jgi:hypothetical protein
MAAANGCTDPTTGAIIGGVTGAVVGRDIASSGRRSWRHRRGGGGSGAIIGGAVGALLGREIARSSC